jgi:hypothetical protein
LIGGPESIEAGLIGRRDSKRSDGPRCCTKVGLFTSFAGNFVLSPAGLIGKLEVSSDDSDLDINGLILTGFVG